MIMVTALISIDEHQNKKVKLIPLPKKTSYNFLVMIFRY